MVNICHLISLAEELQLHIEALETINFHFAVLATFYPSLRFLINKPAPDRVLLPRTIDRVHWTRGWEEELILIRDGAITRQRYLGCPNPDAGSHGSEWAGRQGAPITKQWLSAFGYQPATKFGSFVAWQLYCAASCPTLPLLAQRWSKAHM